MVDFAGGHPRREAAATVIEALDAQLGRGVGADIEFHPGVQYRHIMVAPADWADAECTPPHDLSDKPAVWPDRAGGARRSRRSWTPAAPVVGSSGLAANQIWLWGQGFQPADARFAARDRLPGGAGHRRRPRSAGSACSPTSSVVEVPGATGWYDTDYEGKRDAALRRPGRRRRPVPHPRRGHRRGRPRRRPRREDQGPRGLGPAHPRRPRRGPRRHGPLAAAAAARPPHAARAQDPHHRPVPYLLVDSRRRRPRRHLHRGRPRAACTASRATSSCRGSSSADRRHRLRPGAHATVGPVSGRFGWRRVTLDLVPPGGADVESIRPDHRRPATRQPRSTADAAVQSRLRGARPSPPSGPVPRQPRGTTT